MNYQLIAKIFPLKERMALVAASMVQEDSKREKAIAEATNVLRVKYSGFFWDKEETAQMEALWDAQRVTREKQKAVMAKAKLEAELAGLPA